MITIKFRLLIQDNKERSMSKCFCINHVPLFNHLSSEDQNEIQRLLKHQTYEKGEIIFYPGGKKQLTIISKGQMKVYQLLPSGKEQLLRIAEVGDYEGEMYLFDEENENLYGEALQSTMVCTLYMADFQALLSKYPQIEHKLLCLNAKKSIQTEQQIQFLTMDKVEERLATYLLNLNKQLPDSSTLRIPIPLKELAAYLGTRPETLSRKLKFFEKKRWISRTGRTITLLSLSSLETLL